MASNEKNEEVKQQTPDAETQPQAEHPETAPEKKHESKHHTLHKEVEELHEKLSQHEERYKRTLAEYDNYRKRTQKEREGLYSDAVASTIGSFLPVLDNLERAMAQECGDAEYKKGIDMIAKQFGEILNTFSVKVSGEQGEKFDPNFHEAVMHVEDDTLEENVICEVFRRGYVMGDRVIRTAMVKVAN